MFRIIISVVSTLAVGFLAWRNRIQIRSLAEDLLDSGVKLTTETIHRKDSSKPVVDIEGPVVYITDSGSKYHRFECGYLDGQGIAMALKKATETYAPCGKCRPVVQNKGNKIEEE